MFKRALVSTSNKSGLVEFLKPLESQGCQIVSTGGTSKYLRENGIQVTEVSQVTGFPEVMDGRVRTLHPLIHMGLLARTNNPKDMATLREFKGELFDLVVVNLYPFEEAYFKKNLVGSELIEEIDIGGPSLLRAAAKSFDRITVVCDPDDYQKVLSGSVDKKYLASKVFAHTSYYDSIVSKALLPDGESPAAQKWFTLGMRHKQNLRYGENPQQEAGFFEVPSHQTGNLIGAIQIQGKELSYNNILDLEAALDVVRDFNEPCCAIIKHLNPCGVALGSNSDDIFKKALAGDPVSAFGGIVAFNVKVSKACAEELAKIFFECIVAPDFDESALQVLSQKKNLRVLKLNGIPKSNSNQWEIKTINGGALLQKVDFSEGWQSTWKIVGNKPPEDIMQNMIFAQKVVRHVKSNAISIVSNLQTLGLCGGQTNRVDSVRFAIERAKSKASPGPMVLGSDAFFPFKDSIEFIAKAGIKWLIQPGGSIKDNEVEQAVVEYGLGMVITGRRHFKH